MKPILVDTFYAPPEHDPEHRAVPEGTGAIFWGVVALIFGTIMFAFICGGVAGWYMRGCM